MHITHPANPIRVVIADDHSFFIKGFISTISGRYDHIQVVGESSNGQQLFELVKNLKPQVAITDINMPVINGIQATKLISHHSSECHVLALTMHDDQDHILQMFEAGAKGYVVKNAEVSEIVDAIELVSRGGMYFKQQLPKGSMDALLHNPPSTRTHREDFTASEVKIIKGICLQLTLKEMAQCLFMSSRTIDEHIRKIKEKTEAKNQVGIALYAIKNKIVSSADL